jgi:GT2 family glycosyltransferase
MRNGSSFSGPAMGGAPPARPPSSQLLVSVVIATCGRPQLLLRCLDALARQTLPPHLYDVIVVDDGRSEDTRSAVARFAMHTQGLPVVRYLRPDGTRGPAAARNRGWRASDAPLIAFTDDDTVPDTDWLRQGLRAMSDERVAISGRIVVPVNEVPTDHEKTTRGLESAEFATANAFVRRSALNAIGGFDERFTRPWREDSDLQFSLMECGSVGFAHDAVVVHPVREAPWGISALQQHNMYFDALLYKKHPVLYRKRIRSHAPWHYYVIVGSTLAAIAAALAGGGVAALPPAGVALSLIAAFAAQRLSGTSHTTAHVVEMLLTSIAIPYLAVFWRLAGALHFRVAFS